MRKIAEALVFTGVAAAVHAAVIVGVGAEGGAPEAAGAGGASLVAVTPSLAATVADWERVPEAASEVAGRRAPKAQDAPSVAADTSRPDLPPVLPLRPEPAAVDRVAAAPAPPQALPKREPPPAPPRQAEAAPAPPRAAEAPVGRGQGAAKGAAQTPRATATARAGDGALEAEWMARIRDRIERRKRVPPGNWRPAQATVRLTVARDGRLQALELLRSSGDVRLDDAAVAAVRRAGRFPAAPEGYGRAEQSFTIPMSFVR